MKYVFSVVLSVIVVRFHNAEIREIKDRSDDDYLPKRKQMIIVGKISDIKDLNDTMTSITIDETAKSSNSNEYFVADDEEEEEEYYQEIPAPVYRPPGSNHTTTNTYRRPRQPTKKKNYGLIPIAAYSVSKKKPNNYANNKYRRKYRPSEYLRHSSINYRLSLSINYLFPTFRKLNIWFHIRFCCYTGGTYHQFNYSLNLLLSNV